jgi:hypothetical protein
MEIRLIDAIGPFFRDYPLVRINWSKIPFEHLASAGPRRRAQWDRIREDMKLFAERVAAVGYNAVSLDDLIHLVDHDHAPEIRDRIAVFQEEYRVLFAILREAGLKIFLTQDVLSYTPEMRMRLGTGAEDASAFLRELVERGFRTFPEVEGLILRIGESDGLDVKGDFRSELVIRTAADVRCLLREILPVFESAGKTLIFRTWTVGAYSVGDLLWHRRTLARALKGIRSDALVLSMKYGESDFFRHLPLNRNFFGTGRKTLIELQARREYEGSGEFPSFVGHDYERYAAELREAGNLVGFSVWCQTGGWVPFRRLAYIDEHAVWTEINAFVSLRIFAHRESVEVAVQECARFMGLRDVEAVLELLRLSEEVVKELLYFEDYAREKIYFRRIRIPPLVEVYWHTIFVHQSIRKLLGHFARDRQAAVRTARQALRKLERMEELVQRCGLPMEDIHFMRDTFEILALAREFFMGPDNDEIRRRIQRAKAAYRKKYTHRPRYRISVSFRRFEDPGRFSRWLLKNLFRTRPGYRILDRVFVLHLLSLFYRLVKRRRPGWIPEFARESAMGIDVIFR